MTCAWASRNCRGVVQLHIYAPTFNPMGSRLELCEFHGQAWRRVGETAAAAAKRTARARILMDRKDTRPFKGPISPRYAEV